MNETCLKCGADSRGRPEVAAQPNPNEWRVDDWLQVVSTPLQVSAIDGHYLRCTDGSLVSAEVWPRLTRGEVPVEDEEGGLMVKTFCGESWPKFGLLAPGFDRAAHLARWDEIDKAKEQR